MWPFIRSISNSRRRGRGDAIGDGCLWILAGNWDMLHEYRQLQVYLCHVCDMDCDDHSSMSSGTYLWCWRDILSGRSDHCQCLCGIFLMPVYLDHYLVRTTPLTVNPQDYGLSVDAPAGRPDLLVTWVYGNIKEQRPSPLPPPPIEHDDKCPFSR